MLAYFIFLCVLPVTLVTGIIGNVPLLKILLTDFVTLIAAIFIGIAGLWVSSLFENRSRGIGLIAGLAVYGIFLGSTGLADSPFSGLAGFSPLTTFLPLLGRVPSALRPMLLRRPNSMAVDDRAALRHIRRVVGPDAGAKPEKRCQRDAIALALASSRVLRFP